MTFRDDLLPTLHEIRSIPGQLGLRRYTVEIITTASAGAELGEGSQTATTATVLEANGQPPKLRELTSKELTLGGYEAATWVIGPVTPDFPGGGTALSTIGPDPAVNNTVRVRITGPRWPSGALFTIKEVKHDRSFHYRLVVQRSS